MKGFEGVHGAGSFGSAAIVLVLLSSSSFANLPVKRGTSMCQFDDCSLQSIPRFGQSQKVVETVPTLDPDPTSHPSQKAKQGGQAGQTVKEARRKSHARDLADADSVRTSQAQYSLGALSPAVGKASFLPLFASGNGNLPGVYHGVDWKDFEASDQTVMLSPTLGAKLKGVRVGDVLSAVIEDEIEVWPGATSPVRAFVTRGTYRGATVSGQATIDPSRKKIMIAFDRLKLPGGADSVYSLKAQVREVTGRNGLTGNYHSESGKFLLGEMLSGTAAGFADATISRTQNAQGNYVQEPSLSNAAQTGLAVALSHRAERFAKQEEQAPEWTELEGYQEVQIYVLADPTEDNS